MNTKSKTKPLKDVFEEMKKDKEKVRPPQNFIAATVQHPQSRETMKVRLTQKNDTGEITCNIHGAREMFCACIAAALWCNADGKDTIDCWTKVFVPMFQAERLGLTISIDSEDRTDDVARIFIPRFVPTILTEDQGSLGYLYKGEGRFVIRSTILDRLASLSPQQLESIQCSGVKHSYPQEAAMRSDFLKGEEKMLHHLVCLLEVRVCAACKQQANAQSIVQQDAEDLPF